MLQKAIRRRTKRYRLFGQERGSECWMIEEKMVGGSDESD